MASSTAVSSTSRRATRKPPELNNKNKGTKDKGKKATIKKPTTRRQTLLQNAAKPNDFRQQITTNPSVLIKLEATDEYETQRSMEEFVTCGKLKTIPEKGSIEDEKSEEKGGKENTTSEEKRKPKERGGVEVMVITEEMSEEDPEMMEGGNTDCQKIKQTETRLWTSIKCFRRRGK